MSLNYPANESTLLQLAKVMEEIVFIRHIKDNRFSYISPECQKVLGCSVEDFYLSSSSWISTIHPEDREGVNIAWQKHLLGQNFDYQYQVVTNNCNRCLHGRFLYLQDSAGENTTIVGIVREVGIDRSLQSSIDTSNTESNWQTLLEAQNQSCLQANEELEAQKQLLEKILHALPFSIFLKNRDSQFFFLNQIVRDAFNLQDRESSTIGYEELFGTNGEKFRKDDLMVWETVEKSKVRSQKP